MKYYLCPQGTNCGNREIIAQPKIQSYTLSVDTLDPDQNLCMHKISFSINGGLSDILKLKFTNHVPGAKVYFAIGKTY